MRLTAWQAAWRLAAGLPACTAHWFPGEGHFLVFDHAEEVYRRLLTR